MVINAAKHVIPKRSGKRLQEVIDFVGGSHRHLNGGLSGAASAGSSIVAGGMLDKMTTRLECHTAYLALVRKAALMPLHVDFLVFLAGKGLVAYLTDERLFASVAAIVRR